MESCVMSGQRPELRVKLGSIEIDAKGLAAIRAVRWPIAFAITAAALAVLAAVWGATDGAVGGKAVSAAKWVYAEIVSMPALAIPLVSAPLALFLYRRRKRVK
jgi:hypothetical protein